MVIQCAFKECRPYLNELETRFGLVNWQQNSQGFSLHYDDTGLSLFKTDEPKLGAINVDFVTGAAAHRRKFGGGKGQVIAKAVGLNKGATPVVLDATAGLGRDGFVLASLGCKVILHERHPVVAALLADGLNRAYSDSEIGPWMKDNMSLVFGSSHTLLAQCESMPDVVYLPTHLPASEWWLSALITPRF